MLAAECPQCNLPPSAALPTKDDWNANWANIKRLYFRDGKTLPEVRQHMHEHYNFHAKERQYKTRFNKEQHYSKRLRGEHYQAMVLVLEAESQSRGAARFEAWRGGRRVVVTSQQIYKELSRSRNRDKVVEAVKDDPAVLRKAYITLADAEITPIDPTTPNVHSPSYSADGPKTAIPSSPDGSDSAVSVATPGPVEALSPIVPQFSSMNCQLSKRDPEGFQISLEGMAGLKHQGAPPDNFDGFNSSSLFDPFGAAEHLPDSDGVFVHRPRPTLPTPQLPINPSKQKARGWAKPWVQQIVDGSGPSDEVLKAWKRTGIQNLKFMLMHEPDNLYILPTLNLMAVLLTANGKMHDLEEFLRKSCQIFDEISDEEIPMVNLFRYNLAACRYDAEGQRQYGATLGATYRSLHRTHGDDHPSALVASYYWAWHLLDLGELDTAIDILHRCLFIHLKEFKHVKTREDIVRACSKVDGIIGKYNLMSVNCMNILGRAYQTKGEHSYACTLFRGAEARLEPKEHLQAYRLVILARLAVSEAQLPNNVGVAIKTMNRVIEGRTQLFTYNSAKTWDAIDELCKILRAAGRNDEADTADKEYRDAYARQWYEDKKLTIPSDYQNPDGTPVWGPAPAQPSISNPRNSIGLPLRPPLWPMAP